MALPIDFRCLTHLRDALQAIQGAGYFHDVAADAVKLDPDADVETLIAPGGPRPFILLELSPDRREFVEKPDGLRIVLPVRVHWVGESTPTDDESRLRVFLEACADIETAICLDRSRGGYAVDTLIVARQYGYEAQGSIVWATLDVEIEFYRSYGQPSS